VSYYDSELKIEVYYLVIVETNRTLYKVLSWTNLTNNSKYKSDFQKILLQNNIVIIELTALL
jgi:hypothetical protein